MNRLHSPTRRLHPLLPGVVALVALACAPAPHRMTDAELHDFATRYAAAWSSGDPELFASFYAPGGGIAANSDTPAVGRDAVTAVARSYMTAFPDMVVQLDSLGHDGDTVIFYWYWTGTNTGPGGTGGTVRLHGHERWSFSPEGLIQRSEGHYDEADYQRQLQAGPAAWDDASRHRVQFVAVARGVRLEVLDWGGSGTPLVFLSGLQDVAHGFDDFAPQFTDRHHVLAITRRGYGASSQSPSGYDLATRVADLKAVLDSLGLVRVVLVGHSIAGDELTAFGGAYPSRVAGLIYLDAAYDHSRIGELMGDYPPPPPMTAADSASPAAVRAYLLRTFGQHIPLAQLTAIGRYDSTGRLVGDVTPSSIDAQVLAGCGRPDYHRLRAPILAIDAVVDSAPQLFPRWAEYDSTAHAMGLRLTEHSRTWGAAQQDSLRAGAPEARLLVLHGANHYVFDSNQAEVVAAMRELLAQADAGS